MRKKVESKIEEKKAEPIIEEKDPSIDLAEKMLEEIVKMRESLDKIVKRFV